jgi:ubiquinone/menaquinone biosynthesis C-methylase UbiE
MFYRLYLRLFMVPLGGLLSGNWRAYRYLALSSSKFYGFSVLAGMLQKQHLKLDLKRKFLFGSANLLVATKIPT